MAAAFVVSRLHTASGKALTLSPPVGAEEALVDLQRRAAYALGVGLLQVGALGLQRAVGRLHWKTNGAVG